MIGLVDEESALADLLRRGPRRVTVNLLGGISAALADAFAGVAPAPAALSRSRVERHGMGPGAGERPGLARRPARPDPDHAGWGLLLRAVVEQVEIQANPADDLLCYVRGRYRSLTL